MARGLGWFGQWQCTRPLRRYILMSGITHNNQDVIFQLPTLRTPVRANSEKYGRQHTHGAVDRVAAQKRGVSWLSRCISLDSTTQVKFHLYLFYILLLSSNTLNSIYHFIFLTQKALTANINISTKCI